ncbi:MAG: hypothetical protein A2V70_04580 [Planctomycetes bacterium RBG_13_63_9]|nr:MAG: hypothetical protein A2V70_04580 [Planctomycetes bacterium RBG_13_63_9]
MRVAAPEIETGNDLAVSSYYKHRITDCTFLADPEHYEYPRATWIVDRVRGGRLLEIGCGNGGMTRLMAKKVDHLVAIEPSTPSLDQIAALRMHNVETIHTLVERYQPQLDFDWIVMAEVIEHLRKPAKVVAQCVRWLAPGGRLLVTTPNGHWENDEHLREYSFDSFVATMSQSDAESIHVSYLRDAQGRRRWLAGQVAVARRPPTEDDFYDRRKIARRRRKAVGTRCNTP